MKSNTEFKKDAHRAAKLLCENGLGDVILAFDYKLLTVKIGGKEETGAKFCDIPAALIVSGVERGELPLEV